MLGEVMDEVDEGLERLDISDIWTANSHPLSLLIVSLMLFSMALTGFCIDFYYLLKRKLYWRWK